MKSQLIRKDPGSGNDWRQEEKGTTEDEMVGWHHWLNGHEFEQAPGDSERQGSLVCCSPWGRKGSDTTEWLKNNKSFTVLVFGEKSIKHIIFSKIRYFFKITNCYLFNKCLLMFLLRGSYHIVTKVRLGFLPLKRHVLMERKGGSLAPWVEGT